MILRRAITGGAFLALTFLFVYGNSVFFSNAVPESSLLGWASTQGVRVLKMPGESFRQKVVSEHDIWNQSFNTKARYWIGVGTVGSFLIGCVAGALFHAAAWRLLPARPARTGGGEAADASSRGTEPGWTYPVGVASLAVSLLGCVAFGHILGYGAVIMGWVVFRETTRDPSRPGRKYALAGMVIGAAALLVWVIALQIQPPLHAFEG